jgi:hypothetical protein
MPSKKCSKGEIRRKSYTRKSKSGKTVRVKSACIKATGAHGVKSATRTSKIIRSMLRKQASASQKTQGSVACPKGYILRSAYQRKSHERKSYSRTTGTPVKGSHVDPSVVAAKCIKSQGHDDVKGLYDDSGKRIYIVLEKGSLGKHGYHNVAKLSKEQRHTALDKAISELNGNWLSVFRKINYLAVLNKYHPKMYEIFVSDREYIKQRYSSK